MYQPALRSRLQLFSFTSRKISRLNFQQCKFRVDLLIVGCLLWHLPQHCNNPAHVNYMQHLLRDHLYECFIQNSISPFPEAARRKKLLEPRTKSLTKYFVCVDYRKMARWSSVANVWSGITGILMLQRTSGIMMLCGIVVRANSNKYFKLCMFVVLILLMLCGIVFRADRLL